MVLKYMPIMILTEYCFKDGDSIVVDVTDEYDKILGLRQDGEGKMS